MFSPSCVALLLAAASASLVEAQTGTWKCTTEPSFVRSRCVETGKPEPVSFKNRSSCEASCSLTPWRNSSRGVHRFQCWDWMESAESIAKYGSSLDFVWGASAEKVPLRKNVNPDVVLSSYIPMLRDFRQCVAGDGSTRRDLAWWQKNKPDWIVYQCDRKTPAWQYGDQACVPLDITNPQVLEYQVTNCSLPAKSAGFDAMAVDNYGFDNPFGKCGIWRDAQWVQLYSGNLEDARFYTDIVGWTAKMAVRLHGMGLKIIPNWSTHGQVLWNTTEVLMVTSLVDGFVNEAGFVSLPDRCGYQVARPYDLQKQCHWTEQAWENQVNWVHFMQRQNEAMYSINYWGRSLADISSYAPVRQWIVGSRLMWSGAPTAVWMGGTLANMSTFPEFNAPIGEPLEPATRIAGKAGVWRRRFSHGLVLMNVRSPSEGGNTTLIHIPDYEQYRDCEHNPVPADLRLEPFGASILLLQEPMWSV